MTVSQQINLIILETSDVHGNIFPINYGTNEETPLGLAKIATVIKKEREKNPYTLLIDNGDLIQGTPLTYHYIKFANQQPNPMIKILNSLEYDAAVIGNHEFNYGMKVLNQAVHESAFPWLSCNILHKATKEPYFGKPYIIKSFANGLRVAVLGVTTHYIPNWENPYHISELAFEVALQATKKWVEYLRDHEQFDLLVVSYHGGFEKDLGTGKATEPLTGENQAYEICHSIQGIDVLLTGHQHRTIASESLNGVSVVQPSFNGKGIGKITIKMEKQHDSWAVCHKKAEVIMMDDVETDQDMIRLTYEYEDSTQKWLDQPIGSIEGDMTIHDPMMVRVEEHPLIEFINKVQMEATGAKISNTALFNNSSRGFTSKVTMRDLVSNYVYPNTLTVLQITGADMKAALEQSATYFKLSSDGQIMVNSDFSEPKPQHYNYDMWEGIHYIIDVSEPAGHRIKDLSFNGKPVDPDELYEVVMNNYRAGGGGEYTMFKNKPVIKEIQTDMTELLANYFLTHQTIRAEVNYNWKVVGGRYPH
ncbi:2',3'-cyclic-nucleotide 2'-phosphodiesterase/3'-nucleotidase [Bacillus oleivorans]|uniref:2',3'-cyclic-nucleotide 2'-phosphodiesterase/3'-nucleotidase n=1 Tax=Bacillus oleivorans TaxID=1448271 RepID=A0A285D2A5_9BACI|nr:bifunctional UDP-sugar hydrolase/5'-nucleotidase [Bacillus oleivorans]SNX73941.1 2',3'-cyclic-nucleotide 2'-phosphodiesterase/3'-nucleotidase [Bacillus oleivorans]